MVKNAGLSSSHPLHPPVMLQCPCHYEHMVFRGGAASHSSSLAPALGNYRQTTGVESAASAADAAAAAAAARTQGDGEEERRERMCVIFFGRDSRKWTSGIYYTTKPFNKYMTFWWGGFFPNLSLKFLFFLFLPFYYSWKLVPPCVIYVVYA